MRHRSVPLLVTVALALAACGGDDSTESTDGAAASTSTTVTATATTPPEEPAATATAPPAETTSTTPSSTTTVDTTPLSTAASEPGPFPVGVTTRELPTGNLVEIWYPAADGVTGTDTYEVRDLIPEAIRALLTADIPAGATTAASRDAAPADAPDGGFPIVAYSHGFSGFRMISSLLTSHLASWGMVVVAPDHPSRELASLLGGEAVADTAAADDLAAAVDIVVAESQAGDPWEALVDPDRVALIGHSAGGGTVIEVARADERVDGYVSMAGGRPSDDAEALPGVPSFFLAGSVDDIVSATERTRPAFDDAPAPSRYWELDGVGHNGFDDLCTFGGGTGIIGIAEASGLGALLDAQPLFRAIGEDGCLPPAIPVEESFPVIHHGVTTWLLDLFGTAGDLSAELGPAVGDLYGVGLTVASKP